MSFTETPSTGEALVAEPCQQLLADANPATTPPREFLGLQFDRGLAWVHFPVGDGGLGKSARLQRSINQILFAAGAPNPVARNPIGHGMCAPTVVAHGSAEQRARYMRPLFTSEEVWCQLLSEPGAGSDQKVWTTLAHLARWGCLVVRTDSDSERLGEVGAGWRIAITTLMNERVSIGGSIPQQGTGPVAEAVKAHKPREPTTPRNATG